MASLLEPVQGRFEQGYRAPARPHGDSALDIANGPYAQPGKLGELFLGKPGFDAADPDHSVGSAYLAGSAHHIVACAHVGSGNDTYPHGYETKGFFQPDGHRASARNRGSAGKTASRASWTGPSDRRNVAADRGYVFGNRV